MFSLGDNPFISGIGFLKAFLSKIKVLYGSANTLKISSYSDFLGTMGTILKMLVSINPTNWLMGKSGGK